MNAVCQMSNDKSLGLIQLMKANQQDELLANKVAEGDNHPCAEVKVLLLNTKTVTAFSGSSGCAITWLWLMNCCLRLY